MKLRLLLLVLLCVSGSSAQDKSDPVYASDQLKIKSLSEHVFMHISYLTTNDFGKVDCNGMIYLNGDEAIVFDTPTNDKASAELIDWIKTTKHKRIKAVVVTHFHEDCLGGLQAFHQNGTTSYANAKTIDLARSRGVKVLPATGFDPSVEFTVGGEKVLASYYGAGHTEDNVVGYVPSEEALFGGCLVKCMDASKGFLGDANLPAWSKTVSAVKAKYPSLKTVIPGHGPHGGSELLDYTIRLFRQ